jgi:hypothetical protein
MRKLRKYYWKALKVGRSHAAQARSLIRGYTTRFQEPKLRLGETVPFSFLASALQAYLLFFLLV